MPKIKFKVVCFLSAFWYLCFVPGIDSQCKSLSSHYPDFNIEKSSLTELIIRYYPELSDDKSSIGRLVPVFYNGQKYFGRVFVLAAPPSDDIDFSVNFKQAGIINSKSLDKYISENTPLVVKLNEFSARGRRLIRFAIFPQRIENGKLAVYKDFDIRVIFPSQGTTALVPSASRLDSILASTVINKDSFFAFDTQKRARAGFKPLMPEFDGLNDWIEISIDDGGIYRISGSEISQAGINLINISSDSIRLFYAGGKNPPNSCVDPMPELYEIPISIDDGGDGFFSSNDYLLFYGQSVSRYDYSITPPVYIKNNYNHFNHYWLTVGSINGSTPMRWEHIPSETGTPDENLAVTRQMKRAEQDNEIKIDSDGLIRDYYTWYWSSQPNVSASFTLDNLSADSSIDIEISAFADFSHSTISLNGSPMTQVSGSSYLYHYSIDSDAGAAGLNTAQIYLRPNLRGSLLDYLNISYPQNLIYTGNQLEFNSHGYSGRIRYQITDPVSELLIIDISNPDNPVLIDDISFAGNAAAAFQKTTGASTSHFIAFTGSNSKQAVSLKKWEGKNLYTDLSQCDGLIISPKIFQNSLEEYAGYRMSQDGYRLKLAALEDIYDQFGFGLESPQAIRNYLKFAYENYISPAPFAAILVGDGHYDFMDNMEQHIPSYIPPFIWDVEQSGGDDNYVYFGDIGRLDSDSSYILSSDRGWDMLIARWPVRSNAEISTYIAKLRRYNNSESNGSWRSRVTFVADDEFKRGFSGEIIHTAQAETLAVYHTPPEMIKHKIYATEYPFSSGGEKPAVNDAIVNALNEGTLIVNYIGHGSPDVWADEHIFNKNSDLGRLNNTDKPFLVIAGSCSIGKFDIPGKEGMAEMMFRLEGGALSTVSATRLVYSRDNAIFSYDLYDALFDGAKNICEAVFSAKLLHQYERSDHTGLLRNDRSYVVFGDPFGDIGLPKYNIDFYPVDDSVLTPLQYFGFTGKITDDNGTLLDVDGYVDLNSYDSRFIRHHTEGLDYSLGGPLIFKGSVAVNGGIFNAGFMVPLDIDYGGAAAQISGFATFGASSALGIFDSLSVARNAATTTDNTGPSVEYYFEEVPEFVSGGIIPAQATLIIILSDNSGINLSGGLGHRIELILDNDNNTMLNLTELFEYDRNSYQQGRILYTLPELSPEQHSFRIRVWDNANNPGIVEFEAITTQAGRIAINNVMNYPNPMEEYTEFFFELTESAEWAEVQIFTLAGRKIQTLRGNSLNTGRNRNVLWTGRDLNGDRVAEGVYIYKIIAKGRVISGAYTSDNISEAFGKLVLLN